jgi:hypothetical protein
VTASIVGGHPHLEWDPSPQDETDVIGYNIYKEVVTINGTDNSVFFRSRNTTSFTDYVFDTNVRRRIDQATYWVCAIDDQGKQSDESDRFVFTGLETPPQQKSTVLSGPVPAEYGLGENFPNPFNPRTIIKYQLPYKSHVTIKIFDIRGNEIISLVDGLENAGYRQVEWDGRNSAGQRVAAGMYIYYIHALAIEENNEFRASKKMILLK